MSNNSELAGSVRPYFARSIPRSDGDAGENKEQPGKESLDAARGVILDTIRTTGWPVNVDGDVFVIRVSLGLDRKQAVSVDFTRKDEFGRPLIVYSSPCGPATERNALALLRRNRRMYQTAFATEKHNGVERILLRGFQRLDGLSPTTVTKMIQHLAQQADTIELKLLGTDTL